MLIKKEVIRKRLQKKLEKCNEARAEYLAAWPAYKVAMIKHYVTLVAQLRKADSLANYHRMARLHQPETPHMGWGIEENEKRIKRNLAILDALEGDAIEVAQLKTGRNFTIESMFEEDLAD